MRRNRNGVKIILSLCMAVILAAMLGPGNVLADDVDVYRTSVKNSAMLVIDNSGSMSWPVYDGTYDYANFMEWMLDPAGDGSVAALATDSGNAYPSGAASNAWWDADGTGPTTYDRLVPDRIYLVSSDVGHNLITYTDSEGVSQQVSALGDVMWRTGSGGSNFREEWIKNGIVELKNSAGDYWTLPSVDTSDPAEGSAATLVTSTTIETVQDAGDSKYYVVYPTNTFNIVGGGSVDDAFAGQRLKNAQDTLFVNQVADPRTGTVTDRGFVGTLKTSGYYFSGLFEKSGGAMDFTDVKTNWVANTVYVFATGRWLNFIKLVEDFNAVTYSAWYNYSFQQTLAWRNICDKSMGTTEPLYTSTATQILSHDPEVSDYPNTPTGDFEKQPQGAPGTKTTPAIEPPGTVAHVKVRFEYIDTDYCGSGTDNDYVDLQDANGNSLLAIRGQQILQDGSAGSGAAVSTDGGVTWTSTNPLDADGYTQAINTNKIRVVWHNGSTEGCSGYDRGFKIVGYKYTDQVATAAGDYLCTNGSSGYGYKIRSRMDVAKSAMKKVVDETKDLLKWGVTSFNTSPRVVKALGGTSSQVITAISSLTPSGGTPLGKALQDAYDDSNYDFYETNSDEAQCAKKYIIAMSDGFPTGDDDWDRIDTAKDGNPDFDDTGETYVDDPNDYSNHSASW